MKNSKLKQHGFDYLMQHSRKIAYQVAQYAPKRKKNGYYYLKYVAYYQDTVLFDIAIKRNENVHINNSMSFIDDVFLSHKNYSYNSLPKERQNTLSNTLFNGPYAINYDLDFYKKILGHIKQTEDNKKKIYTHIHFNLSQAMKHDDWLIYKNENLNSFLEINKLLLENQLFLNSENILQTIPEIVLKFSNIYQWETFLLPLENGLLFHTDNNGNNFIHYFLYYLYEHGNNLISNIVDSGITNHIPQNVKYFSYISYSYSHLYHRKNSIDNLENIYQLKNYINAHIIVGKLFDFLEKFWEKLESMPNFDNALEHKNLENKTPIEMTGNNDVIKHLRYYMLNKKLTNNNNKNKVIKI